MNFPKDYDEISKISSLPELAEIMAGKEQEGSKANFAKLIYENLQRETQHKLNMELINKQLRWMKFAAIFNSITIIAAVLLGFFLQELKSYIFPKSSEQQAIQMHQETSNQSIPELHYERKSDK